MRVRHKTFKGAWGTWEAAFDEAGEFASRLDPLRLITISHSEAGAPKGVSGLVTVWYWEDETPPAGASSDRRTPV